MGMEPVIVRHLIAINVIEYDQIINQMNVLIQRRGLEDDELKTQLYIKNRKTLPRSQSDPKVRKA
jgi:hypothetical protein